MAFASTLDIRMDASALRRMIGAGAAWGTATTLGISFLQAMNCSAICLSDVALTGALSIIAGIVTIGPLVAFYPRRA